VTSKKTDKFSKTSRSEDAQTGAKAKPCAIFRPSGQRLPLVLASPHSGSDYAPEFIAASRLDARALRRSEDCFVDELFAGGPARGAPLLCALFPRAFVDPNREPYELDPEMFVGSLPDYVNSESRRVSSGLGTIARIVGSGSAIYRNKLSFAEAERRINDLYRPYHAALEGLIRETLDRFGCAILLDCHSMPSVGGPMDRDPGARRVDFVLGDRHGASCHPSVTASVAKLLSDLGYVVRANDPYAGGYTTLHYGRPLEGVHSLQIEINRALYMDEINFERGPDFDAVAQEMSAVIDVLGALDPASLAPLAVAE
jgi:N-formylglutamate amidohydrolase